jgi:hypothetical protein
MLARQHENLNGTAPGEWNYTMWHVAEPISSCIVGARHDRGNAKLKSAA